MRCYSVYQNNTGTHQTNMSVYSKTGVFGSTHFFLILLQNIDCVYSLESPRRCGSNVYLQSMFLAKNIENINYFLQKIFIFLVVSKICILHTRDFVFGCIV